MNQVLIENRKPRIKEKVVCRASIHFLDMQILQSVPDAPMPNIHKTGFPPLVDRHSARYWSMFEVWKLGIVWLLGCFLTTNLSFHNVWFQAQSEVGRAHNCVDDRENDQYDRDGSETCQTLADWKIVRCLGWLVHPRKLEDEVGQSAEEEENRADHSNLVLSASPECCHEQNQNGNWDRSNG
jgi:hypothetical protein